MAKTDSTRTRLVETAAHLFRRRGYHGVGLQELLRSANSPKGSLYHHFPDGKADLALAAAEWASNETRRVISDSFENANSFEDGASTLCHKLAKLFDITGQIDGCPISGILFEDPSNATFQNKAGAIYDTWINDVIAHAERLGTPTEDAKRQSEHLFLLLQGGWMLARVNRNSDYLRMLTQHL